MMMCDVYCMLLDLKEQFEDLLKRTEDDVS